MQPYQQYGYPPQSSSKVGLVIGLLVGFIVLCVIIVVGLYFGGVLTPAAHTAPTPDTSTQTPTPSTQTPTQTTPVGRTYTFIQGMDAGGNDIKYSSSLANNITALKADCDATTGCVGFNTNGYMKSKIVDANLYKWTSEPAKGIYKLNVERFNPMRSPEMFVNWNRL